MHVLTVRAFGDFDSPYEINVCASTNKELLNHVANTLNSACKNHPECNNDCPFIDILDTGKFKREIMLNLTDKMSREQATNIIDIVYDICKHNSVYIYPEVFVVDTVLTII